MCKNKGTCPVCNGSKQVQFRDKEKPCHNCGGQYATHVASGTVNLKENGEPCEHVYKQEAVGSCVSRYTCKNCSDTFELKSGRSS